MFSYLTSWRPTKRKTNTYLTSTLLPFGFTQKLFYISESEVWVTKVKTNYLPVDLNDGNCLINRNKIFIYGSHFSLDYNRLDHVCGLTLIVCKRIVLVDSDQLHFLKVCYRYITYWWSSLVSFRDRYFWV